MSKLVVHIDSQDPVTVGVDNQGRISVLIGPPDGKQIEIVGPAGAMINMAASTVDVAAVRVRDLEDELVKWINTG